MFKVGCGADNYWGVGRKAANDLKIPKWARAVSIGWVGDCIVRVIM